MCPIRVCSSCLQRAQISPARTSLRSVLIPRISGICDQGSGERAAASWRRDSENTSGARATAVRTMVHVMRSIQRRMDRSLTSRAPFGWAWTCVQATPPLGVPVGAWLCAPQRPSHAAPPAISAAARAHVCMPPSSSITLESLSLFEAETLGNRVLFPRSCKVGIKRLEGLLFSFLILAVRSRQWRLQHSSRPHPVSPSAARARSTALARMHCHHSSKSHRW